MEVSNLPPATYTVNANGVAATFELLPRNTSAFQQVLVDALNRRDYELQKVMHRSKYCGVSETDTGRITKGPKDGKKEIVFQQNITPMAVPVKHVDPPRPDIPRTNWQVLGQLKLRAESSPDGTIKTWLMNTLHGFSLPSNLVSRLLASMEEATARVLSLDSTEGQFESLEIAVLGPAGQLFKGETWGFFRVERATTDSHIESAKVHYVEYYLYLDKKKGEQKPIIR